MRPAVAYARRISRKPDQASARSLTWEQVRAWRLSRQHLDERMPLPAALDVVADICGLHAQVMSSAELALWARIEDVKRDTVSQLLWEERSLVKTWAMRGTLHLLPSREFRLWQAALGTYSHYLKPAWLRAFGVSRDELEELEDAVADALDGRALTRQGLADEVTRITGSADLGAKLLGSWGPFLKPAAFRGHLCFAPSVGQNVRFTGPQRWLGDRWPATPADPDAAIDEVTTRFLSAHGPATRDDFSRWWAITPAQAGKLLARRGDTLTQVEVNGTQGWMPALEVEAAAGLTLSRSVRLLPAFDHYVVGATRHADRLLAGDFAGRVYRPQGWLSPVVLVNGRMDGVWRHERRGRRVMVAVEPFVTMAAWARRAVEEEADRLAAFLGGTLELSWTA